MTPRALLAPLALFTALAAVTCCQAGVPSDELLPNTTKGYVSVAKMSEFRTKWDSTQLGQLMNDPLMQPFVEDFKEQLRTKLGDTGRKIGVDLTDLEGLCDGELCIAVVQPEGDKKQHALVGIVDVTNHLDRAEELIAKIRKNQTAQGAKRSTSVVHGIELVGYTTTKPGKESATQHLYHFLHDHTLVSTDHPRLAQQLAERMVGNRKDSLKELAAYHAALEQVAAEAAGDPGHVRWFLEPFGYAEVTRAAAGGRKKRGIDMLKVLANQGFSAVQGAAGQLTFATGQEEILHRAFIYAPKDPKAKGNDKYRLAARMLDFPNGDNLQPEDWLPPGVATHLKLNAKIPESFEYVSTLVDEIAGDEGVFEDVIRGIAVDRNGPQVNLRKDLIQHADGRITVFTDCRLPITTKSERLGVAFGTKNPAAVAKTIDKIMESDSTAKKHLIDGHVVWEIIHDAEVVEVDTLKIEGVEFTAAEEEEAEEEEADKPIIPNSAITVAHGHLIWATHVDFIKEVLAPRKPAEQLSQAVDFKLVDEALTRLKVTAGSFRSFGRTDEAYYATYELLRMGKMPESETVLAKILNKLLGPEDEDELREQKIDGSKLPPFESVRKYLGPSGMSVRSDETGWYIVGCLLTKTTVNAAPAQPTAAP